MKITRGEAPIVAALLTGPKTMEELCDLTGCTRDGIRRHVCNIREKLPAGGVSMVLQYSLTGDAPVAVSGALARCVPA